MLSESEGIMKERNNYFNELLNGKEEKAERANQTFEKDEVTTPQPLEKEINNIIMELKNNKTLGPTEISAKMLCKCWG